VKRIWKTAPLGEALRNVLVQQGLERGMREQRLFLQWEEIVGTAISRQAVPQRLRNGQLWLQVTDAAWRHELSLMRVELAAKINMALGEDLVREIRLR
jgi:predicted nucleic acid-binding Zn ribbon protein